MAKSKKRSSKQAARGKGARGKSGKKSGKKAAGKKGARKAAAKKSSPKQAAASGLEALAEKIVRMSQLPHFGPAEVRELYHADAVSVEGNGNSVTGHAALDDKMKGWHAIMLRMVSTPRNVWTGGNTICIEWDSTVTMRDGRTVQLQETAVHEIRGGKIQSERYYYNPATLAPPQQRLPGI